MKKLLSTSLISLSLILSACSSDDEVIGSTEEYFYNEAVEAMENNDWQLAISIFQQLEAQFPFGQYAAQAQIELVYAYYQDGEAELARAAADRFIRLYPDDDNIDYAYYMKGLAFYTEDASFLGRWLPTDPSKRDPGNARESFADFSQLITRFPNSPYAADARARMIYLRNLLASYEIHVAEFYTERQAYLSALNRARYVVENYQEAPAVPRALEIMTEMYLRLGLDDLANNSLDILKSNFPDSGQLDENGNFIVNTQITDPSVLYTMTFGVLGSNRRDTPLAPTRRPDNNEGAFSFEIPQEQRDRSLLNILTLGMLGDPGTRNPMDEIEAELEDEVEAVEN
ncbi:MAG: outer membrane protein assembly factor BamD [Gammaproteobacteria bacterium]|mgnify:CR=1 FL=1|nr:outer membrane protein assembly factor BamD [Gammaproteobacteria bacterium]